MPHKQKATMEEKVNLARACIEGKMSQSEASRKAGVKPATVQAWINRYKAEGADAFRPYEHNRVYPLNLKRNAVQDYLKGEGSLLDICRKYKIRSKMQLQTWIKVYNAHGDFGFVKESGGGSYMRKTRRTTQEERIQIVKECLEAGKNYGAIALKHNVSYQQVRTRCASRRLARQGWKTGAASARGTKCRGRNWKRPRSRLSSSSISSTLRKWSVTC